MLGARLSVLSPLLLAASLFSLAYAVFALARVKQDLLARLRSFGLAGKIGEERLFPTLPSAKTVSNSEYWFMAAGYAPVIVMRSY